MAELASYKDTASSRHLRFKLQSLSRRLDELEEATKSLQKAEDELLELQDKVIQAEGGGSSMLADIEALRQRVLKIEGKDEEIKRAEDLCQLMKEKLEEEEKLTRELRAEVERLQKRMADLEKLEEAFSRSKNDCTQLCLSLNEERNLTKKISSELEMLRGKVRELESSEDRLDKTEQSLASELEKLKALTLSFVSERKYLPRAPTSAQRLVRRSLGASVAADIAFSLSSSRDSRPTSSFPPWENPGTLLGLTQHPLPSGTRPARAVMRGSSDFLSLHKQQLPALALLVLLLPPSLGEACTLPS